MKVLIDTNVIIDILEHRESFDASYRVIQLGIEKKLETIMSAGAVTDVYYIINRSLRDAKKAKAKIVALRSLVGICDTTAHDINTALTLKMADFEDAVIAAIAKRERAEYIITRNGADFANSPVSAISPAEFLANSVDTK